MLPKNTNGKEKKMFQSYALAPPVGGPTNILNELCTD